ncbi:hypothetical protein, partial [Pleomorphochaeta sp. DL1XJH-081]|uniref:hypothetical protein n=1 Tax=Pleomorphochaeta sp. DL1XJH-081 TaxID=3409690 RepID=UPI003BB76FA9
MNQKTHFIPKSLAVLVLALETRQYIDFYFVSVFSFDMKVNNIKDGIDLVNAREKPLAAYIFTNDKKLKE